MAIPMLQVDAFTAEPLAGNPAAVCLLETTAPEEWLQRVARENNLSETAYLSRRPDGDFDLRWFTPVCEVDLCGHATLATAHAVWEWGLQGRERAIRFHTRSGALTCRRDGDWIAMDLPAAPARLIEQPALASILGGAPAWVGESPNDKLLAVFESEESVRACQPDLAELKKLPHVGCIITAPSDDARFDFVSRFFCPRVGVDEDPVCGSAHCVLGPYWAERLGKDELMGHQVSARGGVLRVRPRGNRVELSGRAVTVIRGELLAAY